MALKGPPHFLYTEGKHIRIEIVSGTDSGGFETKWNTRRTTRVAEHLTPRSRRRPPFLERRNANACTHYYIANPHCTLQQHRYQMMIRVSFGAQVKKPCSTFVRDERRKIPILHFYVLNIRNSLCNISKTPKSRHKSGYKGTFVL